EAIQQYHEALRLQPAFVPALNNLAWLLSTCEQDKFRSGAEAVQLAAKACELTQHKQTVLIGTLAAAYAEAGDFPKAIDTAQKAETLALSTAQRELAATNQNLLELYRSGKANHEHTP